MKKNSSEDNTSDYWRKLLKSEEPVPKGLDRSIKPSLLFLRPFARYLVSLLLLKRFSLRGHGQQNIPGNAPFIFASNHSSSADFPSIFFCLDENRQALVCALYKKSLEYIPFTKLIIKLFCDSYPIDGTKSQWEPLAKASMLLRSGKIVYIAPEGTRSHDGKIKDFKVGVGALAVESNVPVVPVYIKGSHKALPRGSFIPRKSPISVYFGAPIYPDNYQKLKNDMQAYDVYKIFTDDVRNAILELEESSFR